MKSQYKIGLKQANWLNCLGKKGMLALRFKKSERKAEKKTFPQGRTILTPMPLSPKHTLCTFSNALFPELWKQPAYSTLRIGWSKNRCKCVCYEHNLIHRTSPSPHFKSHGGGPRTKLIPTNVNACRYMLYMNKRKKQSRVYSGVKP